MRALSARCKPGFWVLCTSSFTPPASALHQHGGADCGLINTKAILQWQDAVMVL